MAIFLRISKLGSGEMFKKTRTFMGVSPPPLCSPQWDNPWEVITAPSQCAGAVRGDRHCPRL